MARGALLQQCCSTRCLSCSIVAGDPHLIFSSVNPTQFRLCSYMVNMGATACGGKADSISMPHSSTNMKVWVVHCHPGTQKLNEVYEIYPELTGEVLAHDIHKIFLVYGSWNLQQMTKITFSSVLFVLVCMVRNITAFYSGCWSIATQRVLPLPLEQKGSPELISVCN